MSIILSKVLRSAGNGKMMHWCEGCKMRHMIWTNHEYPAATGALWTYDGNHESPTFHPSVSINLGMGRRCHYFIVRGQIQYCGDSSHDLKNLTVPLAPFPSPDEDDEPEDYMNMK